MKLVIVESPAKAKTIERFLGAGYEVGASYGHVRDLPRTAKETPEDIKSEPWARLAVDTDHSYRPTYIVPAENKRHIAALRKAAKRADEILLATDEDREGESISWHLVQLLKPKVPARRIAFHEITRPAIQRALANPRPVNDRLVRAQEARRVLDRLFGYELSPVLWRKVRAKLSAGRVQSVALRLIVEREEERLRFKASEYWRVVASLSSGDDEFQAALVQVGGKRAATGKDFDPVTGALKPKSKSHVIDEQEAEAIVAAAGESLPWRVASVERKSARQRPPPPFTTSSLQQAASGRLRMSPRKTMRVAQSLYEGINLGGGDREGLITYMRTDSLTLSAKALADAGDFIRREYGADERGRAYYGGPRRYKTKSKLAQEAHEAIRPTEIRRTPASLRSRLDADQLRLYDLIWSRTVASQMTDALVDRTTVLINATIEGPDGGRDHVFRASGSVLRFAGYLKAWREKRKDQRLPYMEEGDPVHAAAEGDPIRAASEEASATATAGGSPSTRGPAPQGLHPSAATPSDPGAEPPDPSEPARRRIVLASVDAERRVTKPPSRYSEASLVKKLEEEGIGRPSTYASTLSTLQDRDYVRRKGGLVPTYVGMAVILLLRKHFDQYVDIGFTARMEDDLDGIAGGGVDYRRFLHDFYRGADGDPGLKVWIDEVVPSIEYPALKLGTCPDTDRVARVRIGRRSEYVECIKGDSVSRGSIPDGLLIDELTVQKACELCDTERLVILLGDDPETKKPVYLKEGPYGLYVQLGEDGKTGSAKPRRTSVPKETRPQEVGLELAVKLLSLPRLVGKDPKTEKKIWAKNGRYGPYLQCEKEYRNLESLEQARKITLEEALVVLAAPRKRRARTRKVLKSLGKHPGTGAPVEILDGRYGAYATDGDANGSIPRGRDPMSVTLAEAVELIAAGALRKKARAKSGRARRSPKARRGKGGATVRRRKSPAR